MSKPAARVGDMTITADPILPPGAITVLTMGQPQAVIGDLVTGATMTGAITLASATVLTGGRPAARMGDMVTGVHSLSGAPLTQTVMYPCAPTVLIGG